MKASAPRSSFHLSVSVARGKMASTPDKGQNPGARRHESYLRQFLLTQVHAYTDEPGLLGAESTSMRDMFDDRDPHTHRLRFVQATRWVTDLCFCLHPTQGAYGSS